MNKRIYCIFLLYLVLIAFSCAGCTKINSYSDLKSVTNAKSETKGVTRDNTPQVLVPLASGTAVGSSTSVNMDYSNSSEGYVMVQYLGNASKVKLQIQSPDGITYTYLLSLNGVYDTFPLSGGSGSYRVTVLENVSGDTYAVGFTGDFTATLADEFRPFLYPNQYVSFLADSNTVAKAKELASDCSSELDVITNVYHYVIKNITYDTQKAQNVQYGYLPNNDATLASGTGICFDYASLMTAMLRSQKIPTKLDVGYAGEVYHAWISTYIEDIGWVDNIIKFDGTSWELMDPTLAANNSSQSVGKYIGDGSSYVLKYAY